MSRETTLSSKIVPPWQGKSLLDYLSVRFRYHTPEEWAGLIERGKVTLNGRSSAPDAAIAVGDTVSYSVALQEPPVDRNIEIIHEEDSFIVASKPGNLPSHADGNFITHTFIHILNEMMEGQGRRRKLKLVHRLDRETSGLLVAARDPAAHRDLARQFEEGSVEKEYIAVARGLVEKNSFEIRGAIGPCPESSVSVRRKVMPPGSSGSSPAATLFEVVERLLNSTVLLCRPLTGRTNQIRVHLDHAGHPLVGDKLYGMSDEQFIEFVTAVRSGNFGPLPWQDAPRHFLHASRLSFRHPVRGVRVAFEVPVPDDMRQYIETHRLSAKGVDV